MKIETTNHEKETRGADISLTETFTVITNSLCQKRVLNKHGKRSVPLTRKMKDEHHKRKHCHIILFELMLNNVNIRHHKPCCVKVVQSYNFSDSADHTQD